MSRPEPTVNRLRAKANRLDAALKLLVGDFRDLNREDAALLREAAVEIGRLRLELLAMEVRYETGVLAALDRRIPGHTDDCDEGSTSGRCLRCDTVAAVKVTFGFSRYRDTEQPADDESEAAGV